MSRLSLAACHLISQGILRLPTNLSCYIEYNYNGYCGEYNHTTLSVVGKVIDVVVGNKNESFASNRVENVTLGEYNVSLKNEATRVTSGSNISEYNFTFNIKYRVMAGTSTAGITFLANEETSTIFAHPQSEDCPIRFNTTQIGNELLVFWKPFECSGWKIATFAGNLSCKACEDVTPFNESSANISFGLPNVKWTYKLCVIAENVCGERTTMQCSSITGADNSSAVSVTPTQMVLIVTLIVAVISALG